MKCVIQLLGGVFPADIILTLPFNFINAVINKWSRKKYNKLSPNYRSNESGTAML